MDPRDQIDIASLAGQSQAYLNKLWNTPRQNRVDPRQILGQQGHPGFPQQQPYGPQGIPPQQFNPQYQQEYPGIPSQLDSGGVNLLPMPMDEKGQPIVPAGVNFIPGMPQAAQGFSMDNAQGFSMPNYGGKDQAAANAATAAARVPAAAAGAHDRGL